MGRILAILVLAIFLPVFLTGQSASGAEKLITPPISDQTPPQHPAATTTEVKDIRPSGEPIVLGVSIGTLLQLPRAAQIVFIADNEVADVNAQGPSGFIYVFGKKTGKTVLYASDADGNIMLNKVVDVVGPVSIIKGTAISDAGVPEAPRTTVIQSETHLITGQSTSTSTGTTSIQH